MIIAFDFDQTLTAYPEFFTTLGKLFREKGHTVYILTGRWKSGLLNTWADSNVPILPNITSKYGEDFYDDLLTWDLASPEENAIQDQFIMSAVFKNRIIKEYHIDIFFDDKGETNYSLGQMNICTVHS